MTNGDRLRLIEIIYHTKRMGEKCDLLCNTLKVIEGREKDPALFDAASGLIEVKLELARVEGELAVFLEKNHQSSPIAT